MSDNAATLNADPDITECGRVFSHSSGPDDSGHDVGLSVGLGEGFALWIGEITKDLHERAGEDAAALGNDLGAWIILFGPTTADTKVIGKAVDGYVGADLTSAIAGAIIRSKASRASEAPSCASSAEVR